MIKIKGQLNQLFLFSSALFFISIFSACEKDPDSLGMDVLPGEEKLLVKQDTTFAILANTIKFDSILSYYPDTAYAVNPPYYVGEYTDPIFGASKSSLFINFYPDSLTYKFGENAKADSLVLLIKLDSIYGDKNTDIEFRIWEMKKPIVYNEKYYSNIREEEYKNGTVLSSKIVKYNDTIRVALDYSIADKVLKIPTSPDKTRTSYLNFQKAFNGLYIEIRGVTQPGVMVSLDPWRHSSKTLVKHETRMILYYQNSAADSLKFNYYPDTRVPKIVHNHAGTTIETALQNNDFSQKVTFVQGMGGLGTRIRIASLSKWADLAPVSINKAELIIPVEDLGLPVNTYPKRLSIMAIDNAGKIASIEYGFGQTFIGGVYDSNLKAYKFNLAKHIQKIANSKTLGPVVENTDFMLVADGYKPAQPYVYNKVALNFSPGKGAKLIITYSKQ